MSKKLATRILVSKCCNALAVWDDSMPPTVEIHECAKCHNICETKWVNERLWKEGKR